MRYTTVRIRTGTRDVIRSLAAKEGESMQAILEKAVEGYRRRRFLEGINAGYASLRRDDRAWADVEEERIIWDATLSDGLVAEGHPPASSGRSLGGKRRRTP